MNKIITATTIHDGKARKAEEKTFTGSEGKENETDEAAEVCTDI